MSTTHRSWKPGESSTPPAHADDAESDGQDGNEGLHGVSRQGLRYVVGGGGSFRDPLEQVAGLAVEHPAHGICCCVMSAATLVSAPAASGLAFLAFLQRQPYATITASVDRGLLTNLQEVVDRKCVGQ